jgi:N-methylhydantoinase A
VTGRTIFVGIDIGGTFSDVVAVSGGHDVLAAFKVPSTPAEPEAAVLEGLRRLAVRLPAIDRAGTATTMFHGTTIATNALIQKRGAKTALLTTDGFRDVLALRRQARPDLYRLDQRISEPLVPDAWRVGVRERIGADGGVLEDLRPEDVRAIAGELRAAGVESVAVCLLHSYVNPAHEHAVAELLRAALPGVPVSLSAELNPELGEFERTSTTVVNAYVAPPVRDYLARLRDGCRERGIAEFHVVKSNGGLTSSANAAREPVHLIESGPAAGLSAVAQLGRRLGMANLIAFDMGGTTAKVGVIQGGAPRLARELYADRYVDGRDVGGYVLKSPVIDLAEIGAGGGSIAWLDAAGVLKVGPHSAGSDPGPACYGLGNDEPTVTDAHLVVGTLDAASDAVPGGLDAGRARDAIRKHVAEPLGWDVHRAAHAILRLATANMAETVRLVTVRRGIDVRDFALVAYGGAGPLHAPDIAAEVGISTIVVPAYPAMFSALGSVMCDIRYDLAHSVVGDLAELDAADLEAVFDGLGARADALLTAESAPAGGAPVRYRRLLDLRHKGQLHEVTVPVEAGAATGRIAGDFRRAYRDQYGYTLPDIPVELVGARLEVVLTRWPADAYPVGEPVRAGGGRPSRTVRDAAGAATETRVLTRADIAGQGSARGPVLVDDDGSVTPVRAGHSVRPLAAGAIVITEDAHA